MKLLRESQPGVHIVCLVGGFNEDPRELCEIPEVRGFCRRLMGQGFASYLDPATTFPAGQKTGKAWGAFELWLCAEGLMKPGPTRLHLSVIDRFEAALKESNAIADQTVGAPGTPTKE